MLHHRIGVATEEELAHSKKKKTKYAQSTHPSLERGGANNP